MFVDMDIQIADLISSHHFWSWIRFSPSRFSKDKSLVNCDACEYVSGGFSSGHLIISCDGFPEYEEVLFDVISDMFVSINSMVFM